MKAYLAGCSFIPITAFLLTSHLKGQLDLLGLILTGMLSLVLLVIVVFPEELARWWHTKPKWMTTNKGR